MKGIDYFRIETQHLFELIFYHLYHHIKDFHLLPKLHLSIKFLFIYKYIYIVLFGVGVSYNSGISSKNKNKFFTIHGNLTLMKSIFSCDIILVIFL